MKKLLYSLLVAGLALTGCANFDDEASQEYASGSDVTINVTATTDSTFTFTLTPGADTKYYSYVVVKGSVVDETLSGSTLLKGQYEGIVGSVINAAKDATYTQNMRNTKTKSALGLPNTSYVIYAIGESDKGMTGNITSQVVSTSDGIAPYIAKKSGDTAKKLMTVTFDGAVVAGTGKVTAKYYEEYGAKYVDIPESEIVVTVKDNIVTISTPKAPAGAIVLISWEKGAFKDIKGNDCEALNSGLNAAGTDFTGVFYQIDKVAFELPRKSFTDNGKVVSALPGTATFDFNIYANKKAAKGDISLVYTTASKTSTYSLGTSQWSVSGKQLKFDIPETPANATLVGLTIKEGTILNDLGNPNQAVTTDSVYWNFMKYTSYHFYPTTAKGTYDFGDFTISSGNTYGAVLFNGFYGATKAIPGYIDLAKGKLYIANYAVIKSYSETKDNVTTNYWIITYDKSSSSNDYIEFSYDAASGQFTSTSFVMAMADEAMENIVRWWIKPTNTTFVPFVPNTSTLKTMMSSAKKSCYVAKNLAGHSVPNKVIKH